MKDNKIGLNIDGQRIDGDLELLRQDLSMVEKLGYDAAEIPVHGVDAIVNGTLRQGRTKRIKESLNQFNLEYTVHAPSALNLRDFRYPETHRRAFESCVRFTAEIGAKKLVYHQGRLIRSESLEVSALTEEEAREIEIDGLSELGELAESMGILICVENIQSSITHLVRLVRDVNMKSVGICYDFGHSFINSHRIGYDFIKSIYLAKHFIYHTHVHDNFGKGEPEVAAPYVEGMPMGIGDLHLPVGWGKIPYEKIFKIMDEYRGIYSIELARRFFEDGYTILKEALDGLKEVLERAKKVKV